MGTELSYPDLPAGQSIASLMGGLATQAGNLQSGVDGAQNSVQKRPKASRSVWSSLLDRGKSAK